MTGPRCCVNVRINVNQAKAKVGYAARQAARLGDRWPQYIEAANKAKADYIRARDDAASHAASCAEVTP
jgi:hypothetical protein